MSSVVAKGTYVPDDLWQEGAYALPLNMPPDEILNSLFLYLIKRALIGDIEVDAKTSHTLDK